MSGQPDRQWEGWVKSDFRVTGRDRAEALENLRTMLKENLTITNLEVSALDDDPE